MITATLSFPSFSQGKSVQYQSGTTQLEGYFAKAAGAKAPGVLILHAWMGLTDHEKTTANRLAKAGYHALAADVYGIGVHPSSPAEAGKLAGMYKSNFQEYQNRIKAGIDELVKLGADPNKIVVIGYCFGGTGAIEAARGALPVKGIISFHGGLGKDSVRANEPIVPKVLVLHGADDKYESPKEIATFQQEMRDGHADWQMVYFSGAVHAFTDPAAGNDNSKGSAYNATADRRSWEYMMTFLKEVFGR
ncbi:dienelactone hydrolase family protein [Deminuibacter soli]|uniref:Dienelactone hydrolase family protein n=2 Tax=Deminuibacter soli TaxID=2291815 RepID=A0A3E1NRW3_9BACT|nr:dienelactone hydrolase family protein [Deminuibacter soli]